VLLGAGWGLFYYTAFIQITWLGLVGGVFCESAMSTTNNILFLFFLLFLQLGLIIYPFRRFRGNGWPTLHCDWRLAIGDCDDDNISVLTLKITFTRCTPRTASWHSSSVEKVHFVTFDLQIFTLIIYMNMCVFFYVII